MERPYSECPEGAKLPLPDQSDYPREWERLQALAAELNEQGQIVVDLGMGFVGAVIAAVVADREDEQGRPGIFVLGAF